MSLESHVTKRQETAKTLACILLALVPLTLIWQGQWTEYGLEMDEGMVLLYPQLILDGWTPHRDFETFYTPGNLWLLAGVYSIFGNTIEAARTTGLCYHIALVSGVFLLGFPSGRIPAAIGMVIAGFVLSPLTLTPFAWLLAVALILWALILALPIEKNLTRNRTAFLRPGLVGLLAGLAVLVRQDIGLAMLLVLAAVWLWGGTRKALIACAGITLGLAPLAWHLLTTGWQPLWDNLVAYPIFHTRGGRDFPFGAASGPERHLVIAAFLCALQLGIAAWLYRLQQKRKSRHLRVLTCWPLLFLTLVHQMLQRVEHIHVAFVAFLPIGGVAAALTVIIQARKPLGLRLVALLPGVVALSLLASDEDLLERYGKVATRALGDQVNGFPVQRNERRFYTRSPYHQMAAQQVVDYLAEKAREGEKLVIGPQDFSLAMANDAFFYYMLYDDLRPGTYFLEFNPGSANRPGTRLAEDVADADWAILNIAYGRHWNEPNTSSQPGDRRSHAVFTERYRLRLKTYIYEVHENEQTNR